VHAILFLLLLLTACGGPTPPAPAPDPAEALTPTPAPATPTPIANPPAPAADPDPVATPVVLPEADADEPTSPARPTSPGSVSDGGTCLTAEVCASGICEGQGCTDTAPGTCMPKLRRCTRDRKPFCGCDGVTFWGSSTCINRRYRAPGLCANAD